MSSDSDTDATDDLEAENSVVVTETVESTEARSCFNCNAPLSVGQEVCTECGTNQADLKTRLACDDCGNHLLTDALFCRRCGKRTALYAEKKENGTLPRWRKKAMPVRSSSRNATECIDCAQLFTNDGKFCLNCGTLRGDVLQCDVCDNVFMDDSKFCRHCGEKRPYVETLYTALVNNDEYDPPYKKCFERMGEESMDIERTVVYQYIENRKARYGGFTGPMTGGLKTMSIKH